MQRSVFILEGDPIQQLWLTRTLRRSGYDCLGAARTARDALLHFPRNHPGPDLLLIGHCRDCDYGLSATITLFRLLHPSTKIILLASMPSMLRAGERVLRKPFSPRQLRGILAETSKVLKTLEV